MQVGMTREVSLHVKGVMLTNDSILTRTSDVVSFAATRPGVTQAPLPAPTWGEEEVGGGMGGGWGEALHDSGTSGCEGDY